ncbi:MAG: hypothetical protein ACJAVE_000667 [Polaribacter sp.]
MVDEIEHASIADIYKALYIRYISDCMENIDGKNNGKKQEFLII